MYSITVAPLVSGIPYEELSYFSKDEVSPGDLVEITIRKRACRAFVLESVPLHEDRQSLKQASFVTKKIQKVLHKHFFDESLWNALAYSASYVLKPVGTLVYDFLSERSFSMLTAFPEKSNEKGFEVLLLEQSLGERMTRFKTMTREMFSKKKSMVIFFPTVTDLIHAYDLLARGVTDHVVTLHGTAHDKEYEASMSKLLSSPHPILILATPSLLPFLRKDLGIVVLEREHSSYYYTHGEHGHDTRITLEQVTRSYNIPILFASHMVSLRSHLLHLTKDAHEIMPLQFRNDTNIHIVSMTEEERTSSPYLSKTALRYIHALKVTQEGHLFVYAHRKGMYPTTVCADCGELFVCEHCKRPYVLHKIAGIRTYVCHDCEHIIQITEETSLTCRHCGSWHMTTLGIATTGVEQELSKLGIPVFVIDGERTPTRAKALTVYKEWKNSSHGILIGTEMAHNLVESCDGVIIMSLDSLFSLPEYRTDEKVLTLVTEMGEKISRDGMSYDDVPFILQTRMKQLPVLTYVTSASFKEVYRTMLKEREQHMLPPYYVVIKASFENLSEDLRARFQKELESFTTVWFEQGKGVTLLFVHVPESEWATSGDLRERVKRVVYGAHPVVNPLHFFG